MISLRVSRLATAIGAARTWSAAPNGSKMVVRVSFDSEDGDAAAESLAQGRRLLSVLRETTDRAASYSATKLLETKNGIWLQAGELPQTHETFVAALKLQSLVVKKDGAAELWFSAGDLFWGHSVQVVVDASGQPTLAVLAG